MNTFMNRLGSLVIGAVIAMAAWPAAADDTELFVASTNPLITGVQPNILFIYDNSGSMDSVVLTQLPWDPNTAWTGCYRADRIYFSTNATAPGCNSNNYIDVAANYCAASLGALQSVGVFADQMLAWRVNNGNANQSSWLALSGNNNSGRPMECQDDRGVHGQTNGSTLRFTANGSTGPWAATSANEPSWSTTYRIWNGNWLNWNTGGGTISQTRLEIIQQVTDNLLQNLNGVNVGLMHFNDNQGGTVARAMENISTARAGMISTVNGLTAETWTPLSETLYEATNYYMGRAVDYGNVGPVRSVAASRTSGTINGTTYRRPALYACQKNYIVILTDGLPTEDVSGTAKIRALPSWSANVTTPNCSGSGDGACMSDLAEYLYRHDLDPALAGLQNVTTYTIGFGVDLTLADSSFLQETARKGGGHYYAAGDTASLQSALTSITLDILDDSTTYTTPTAPVNAFNRTQNLNDVLVSIFAPSINEHWPGNVKKYRLQGGQLVDQNGAAAVDTDTGFFSDASQSYWSASPDGSNVRYGGAANELPVYTSRNLYTNVAGNDLNATGNLVDVSNVTGITAAIIGAPVSERANVINWARGLDLNDEDDDNSTNDIRHVMGDPLHVRPMMVIYGGTQAAPDATVYVSTNDGYLHALDPTDGHELWAFIPRELLGRLYDLYLDDVTPTRSYGLDGEITVYIANDNGQPGISGSERVLLYFGMRRGGDAVYAMDVTNRNDPQFLWKVDSNTAGFSNLGQTWSTPAITRVVVSGQTQNPEYAVAIFGGGYDSGEDNPGYRTDVRGNAIYMVDAISGTRLWSAGYSGHDRNFGGSGSQAMSHSIPAAVKVLDMNVDGLADRMYVGDMGGRLWRFDIHNYQPRGTLVDGGVLATLGAAGLASPALADVRRFYNTPDVAQVICNDQLFLAISLGSGHREHPLDTGTSDEFYSIRDYNVFNQLTTAQYTTPITRANLTDITTNLNPALSSTSAGWRLRMNQSPGEKVVSESRTFASSVFFTSFTPGGNGDACVAAGGLNRLYMVRVCDGAPVANLDASTNDDGTPETLLTTDDRLRVLDQGGIAPEPAFFFPEDQSDEPVTCIGVECFPPGFTNPPVRTIWNQSGVE